MRGLGVWVLAITACGGTIVNGLPDGAEPDAAAPDVTVADVTLDVTLPETSCGPAQCSSDLHSVLDCDGNVLFKCPDDQACSGTSCFPACTAMGYASTLAGVPPPGGCEFYSVVPDVIPNLNLEGGCYVVAVTNVWSSPMKLGVDRAGVTLSGNFIMIPSGTGTSMTYAPPSGGTIAPGATALLFLSQSTGALQACPTGITPAITTDPAVHGTDYGNAFHITTSMPAVAADYVPYGASAYVASATALIPTNLWDVGYVVVDGYVASSVSGGEPSTVVVAMQDGTQVEALPNANIAGSGTVAGDDAGALVKYVLNKGQSLQITQHDDLTGSIIQSNNPIGVWGAHSCLNIDPSTNYCDSAHQQLPPARRMGSDQVGVRYRNRTTTEETPPWRIVGVVNGTSLTWDPPVSGAPTTLKEGQLASFTSAGPFRVKSQDAFHPFYLSAHMTGGASFNGYGDPEFVNVVPTKAWRTSYTFFTQPGFPETSVVVVRANTSGGFQDVTLDCAGKLTGWTPVGTSGMYEYTRLDLSTGNFAGENGCDNGVHTTTSSGPFTVTAWGWGNNATSTYYVSYALPAP